MTIQRLSVVVTVGMLLLTFLGCGREQKGTEEEQLQRQAERIKLSAIEDTKTKISPIDGASMALIPAGEFRMGSNNGSDDEQPVHTVYLDAFYIDKYEVTNAQYKKFMDATGHKATIYWDNTKYNAPDHPVVGVSWDDAKIYAKWAGKRLPTEAEWEKAARGGLKDKEYPGGESISHDDANYHGTSGKDRWEYTSPVGSFAPNGYGLYDMTGNVWELCADWYDADWYDKNDYSSSPPRNPTGPSSGKRRVLRGGSWHNTAHALRCASRSFHMPSGTRGDLGFRCAE